MTAKYYWVYILECENNTFYTGYTNDLIKRYRSHVDGNSRCKFTRSFKPIRIAQSWKIAGDRSLAMQIEAYIKRLKRTEKKRLIQDPQLLHAKFTLVSNSE